MKLPSTPITLLGSPNLDVYWREKWGCYGVNIKQGEYCVTDQPVVITTVLGSCISVCLYEKRSGLGGVNHFMLPKKSDDTDMFRPFRYGAFSMEQMVNQLLKQGVVKERLEAKVIGGAQMMGKLSNIGQLNIDFIMRYLSDEKLQLNAQDLGGDQGRKLAFFPNTGRLFVSKIAQIENTELLARESKVFNKSEQLVVQHGVELF
jgi:chemotaxis protein CheD